MPWTYILKCSDDSYYVGSTVNLEARLSQHRDGRGAAYTRHRLPVILVWAAEFDRIEEAFRVREARAGVVAQEEGGADHRPPRSAAWVVTKGTV
ncbi:MAG: GIY-YIG nuclease family protein [Nocardioides sp.]